jgi:hypothetical protein
VRFAELSVEEKPVTSDAAEPVNVLVSLLGVVDVPEAPVGVRPIRPEAVSAALEVEVLVIESIVLFVDATDILASLLAVLVADAELSELLAESVEVEPGIDAVGLDMSVAVVVAANDDTPDAAEASVVVVKAVVLPSISTEAMIVTPNVASEDEPVPCRRGQACRCSCSGTTIACS